MKYVLLAILIAGVAACTNTKKATDTTLKGRLVVSELCAHYVVEVISGNIPAEKTTASWTDDKRKSTYPIAFTVDNRCSFEKTALKEGDEFSFSIDENAAPENCAVCMAFYPTPPQRLAITNIQKLTGNQ